MTGGTRNAMRVALAAGLMVTTPAAADPFEQFGTAMKYGLPLAAAACAVDRDRLPDFALRGGLQVALVLALKHSVVGPLGQRPGGGGGGFPSGHAAAAGFGAADLARHCVRDSDAARIGLLGAALLAAASRVDADEHTPAQAAAGSAIGVALGASSFGLSWDAWF
ncbi:phosphatase PAP2 family protein [uncultured Paracoccus sp.]|uniref:phosphatase PAP2 family protein n=1 Tax=uncultured Paracoccus sp. TaxID=189685 RepID=UPI00260E0516|nr:phosphatase PAP2 family protein [uncultured Paracoccus sp.]